MNPILLDTALEKLGSPEKLINLIGQRVYELTDVRPKARPLIEETSGLGALDIALLEVIQEKITFEQWDPEDEAPKDEGAEKRATIFAA